MNPAQALARPEIVSLEPYSHAAWLPRLVRLHANEAPWRPAGDDSGAGLNRYPEPQPQALIERLSRLYQVPVNCLLATRGADEAIDLLSRIYLRAGSDAILQVSPTFGMYRVCAQIQGAEVFEVPLRRENEWSLDSEELLRAWRPAMKLVYLCSPNNPTANCFEAEALERICEKLDGRAIVVLDEAYIEWSRQASLSSWLQRFSTLAILRTLSKAHALAGVRVGALLASPGLIQLAARVIPPYALAQPSIEAALRALTADELSRSRERRESLKKERERVREALQHSPLVKNVWPSDTNFLLIDCRDAEQFLRSSVAAGLIVRDLRAQRALPHAVRVTVSSREHNDSLLVAVGAR